MPLVIQGPQQAIVGGDVYYTITGTPDLADADRIYFPQPNLPAGMSVSYSRAPHGDPLFPSDLGDFATIEEVWLCLHLAPTVVAGPVTLTIPLNASSQPLRVAGTNFWAEPVTVHLAVRAAPPQLTTFPTNYDKYEQLMTQIADKWVPYWTNPASDPNNDEMWFYDPASALLQVEEYIRQPGRYLAAAIASAKAYCQYIINCGNGASMAGYRVFSRGLRKLWQKTGDALYLTALQNLANCPWPQNGGSPNPERMRETAFATAYWMDMEWTGAARDPRLARGISFLLGHFDLLIHQTPAQRPSEDDGSQHFQPFMVGLACEVLIDWYQLTQDPRIPTAIADVLQHIWHHGVNDAQGSMLYDLYSPTGNWYCGLNMCLAPAFAWMYRLTGDRMYRDQGDLLFSHFADAGSPSDEGPGIDYFPKTWSQNYRWGIKYLEWRNS